MRQAPREFELKLEIAPRDVQRIKRRLGHLSTHDPVRQTLVSVYFDTPDLSLRCGGVSLRVRRIGKNHVQTIKLANAPTVGLFDRAEWEHPIRGSKPDLALARGTAVDPLLHGKFAKSLRPVFETRVRRASYRLARRGLRIEATLDQGVVAAGKRRSSLCELELELLRGEPDALFEVAKALGEVAPVRLCVKSKADRGYELLGTEGGTAQTAAKVHLSPKATTSDAFRVIGRQCLGQLIANESAMLAGDAEALHQMRIALRRLRAAISVF